jgi:hypothetical protein
LYFIGNFLIFGAKKEFRKHVLQLWRNSAAVAPTVKKHFLKIWVGLFSICKYLEQFVQELAGKA